MNLYFLFKAITYPIILKNIKIGKVIMVWR